MRTISLRKTLLLFSLLLTATIPGRIWATSLLSREEALKRAYPGAQIIAERLFLTQAQRAEAEKLSQEKDISSLVARYRAVVGTTVAGRAYVDTHTVRSKKESLLICLDENGRVIRIEVTAFLEPPEYQASEPWYAQYKSKKLDDNLRLDRSIRPLAGATLTARAANSAVRRVLAIDQVLASPASAGEIR